MKEKEFWYKAVIFVMVYITIFMLIVKEEWLMRSIQIESQYNHSFYSSEFANWAEKKATKTYELIWVETEILPHSFDMFIPSEEEIARQEHMQDLGAPAFAWVEGRLRAFWTLVWSTHIRFFTVALWMPFLPFLVLPWIVDGWAKREIRKHTFDFSSPIQQQFAIKILMALPLIFFIALTMPFPMHPLATPVVMIGIGVALQVAIGQFMKRA
ncbi:MAG: hypothetical protein DDT34_00212 [Firmicutes bacterium]|nr:hypothetical protein [Bacillota bacterium]